MAKESASKILSIDGQEVQITNPGSEYHPLAAWLPNSEFLEFPF